ncbi:GBS Bsp-like repeat-containing protein [Paenibacillus tyrfis]|uniref:GBS Bsp-like repeat-containing protein n=1 Tax=Paenibacillus tyrfis TaxID=1501230 RepID=UPI0020A1124A|nr:GBS Bsp-like repeat-containing protein [Paenibacillus tyrfis]MCP1307954.1 GBS Bsp-like repeat-containing protein [Paenibacillus tyrfis]
MFIAMVSLAIFLFPQLTMAETYYEYKDSKLLNIYSKDNGKFYKATFIHDKNGNIIGKKMVPANAIDYPTVTSYSNASYDIVLFNVDPKAMQVEFPTWTENNGQDDVIWHQGEKVGDGIWKVTIPFSKHKDESGKYITHIYINKELRAVSETLVNLTTSTRIPPTVNLSSGSYDIYLDGVGEHVARVAFPTWTLHNGQDDIVWNEGEKVSSSTWKITIPFSEHNQEIGEYITHIYSYDRQGNAVMSGFGQTSAVGGISAPAETSYSNASFDITAYGIDPKATQVEFPTWTAKDGKDVIWYQGKKVGSGAWKVTIPFNKHNAESGKYITHVYVDKELRAVSETMVNLTTSTRIPPTVNLSSGSYDVYIDGVGEHVARVAFLTWTKRNGQDDLVWKEGTKVGANTWKITIPFSQHNQETGDYITHIYSYDRQDNTVMIGYGQTTVVGGISAPAETSYSNASFDITAYGIDPKATQVEFPTWTAKDGRDVIWYQGEKVGNGVWKATVPFNKHNAESGKYITHVYVDKELRAVSETMVKLTSSTRVPSTVNLSSGSYDIYIDGVGEQVARVSFPTWTQRNGADDIVWKDGYKVGANTWRVTIPFSEHNRETGEYITHIYSYDRQGNAVMVGYGSALVN